jgi:hypothetical protein
MHVIWVAVIVNREIHNVITTHHHPPMTIITSIQKEKQAKEIRETE